MTVDAAHEVGYCRERHRDKECGGEMVQGIAIQQTSVGIPDFIGSTEVCTVSQGGSGKIVPCAKCIKCGHSRFVACP